MRISAFWENIGEAAKQTGQSVFELLSSLKKEGLQSVYICYSFCLKEHEQEIMALLKSLDLSLEGLWDVIQFHVLSDEDARSAYEGLVDCAARNGAGHVLIVPGAFYGPEEGKVTRREVNEREPEIRRMIERMRQACAYGQEKKVAVTMEDYDVFCSPIVYPEVLRRFFEEIPDLQMSFDTGNFIPCDRDVREEFACYRGRIATFHLKDRVEGADLSGVEKTPYVTESGRKFFPAVTGCGQMQIPFILSELKKDGYDGAGIIELFGSADMAGKLAASVRWLKQNA